MAAPFGDRVGGIRSLHRLLTEHGEAIEADLRRYYQRSLTDLATGAMSIRELIAYVRHMPPGSALQACTDGHMWDINGFLLADLYGVWACERHPSDPRKAIRQKQTSAKLRELKRRRDARRRRMAQQQGG